MKNKQNGFMISVIIIIIALLGIGGGVYVYTNKKVVNPPVTNIPEVVSTTPAPIIKDEPKAVATTSTTVQKTNPITQVSKANVSVPRETFIKFRTEFDATKTFDEAFAVTIKYSTKEKSDFYKSQQSQVTDDMKAQLFPSLKLMMPSMSTITIVNENITGDIALLSLKTNISSQTAPINSSQIGTVTLKKESGIWKIEGESWK